MTLIFSWNRIAHSLLELLEAGDIECSHIPFFRSSRCKRQLLNWDCTSVEFFHFDRRPCCEIRLKKKRMLSINFSIATKMNFTYMVYICRQLRRIFVRQDKDPLRMSWEKTEICIVVSFGKLRPLSATASTRYCQSDRLKRSPV